MVLNEIIYELLIISLYDENRLKALILFLTVPTDMMKNNSKFLTTIIMYLKITNK